MTQIEIGKGDPKTNNCIYNKGEFKSFKYISELRE